jgi:preprotein translocase subunit SecB
MMVYIFLLLPTLISKIMIKLDIELKKYEYNKFMSLVNKNIKEKKILKFTFHVSLQILGYLLLEGCF